MQKLDFNAKPHRDIKPQTTIKPQLLTNFHFQKFIKKEGNTYQSVAVVSTL